MSERLTKHWQESTLIQSLRDGSERGLRYVYQEYFPVISHFIHQNNGEDSEAKDIFQEAVMVLLEKMRNPCFELSCTVKTYLFAIARRLWLKRLKERKRFVGELQDHEHHFVLPDEEKQELDEWMLRDQALNHALEAVGEPCKSVLSDFFLSNLSMEEIAQNRGYANAETVKNQKYKCLKRLRKAFFQRYNNSNHDSGR